MIDNERKRHSFTDEEENGYGAGKDGAMILYPRAFEHIEHRVPGVSNLEGTIIHELSHKIVDKNVKFAEEWARKFGEKEKFESKGIETPGGLRSFWKPKDNYPCVSNLAAYDNKEDICDSMVAALRNKQLLHHEKLKSIQEEVFAFSSGKGIHVSAERRLGKDIVLPMIKPLVKFKREKQKMEMEMDL